MDTLTQVNCYPLEIRELIKVRRKARRIWHQTRHPEDKNAFNRISNRLNRLIKDTNKKNFETYVGNLSADVDTNYSLWKATKKFKHPVVRIPPIKNELGNWMHSDQKKADLFASYLYKTFQTHDTQSNAVLTKMYKSNEILKYVTPFEVVQEIDNNINPKKAPGANEISPKILKELTRKGIVLLTSIFNACFRLEHVSNCYKIAQIIMIKKSNKPEEEATSYKPISVLSAISKLFKKLLLKRIKPLINLPNHQFGFRNQHSTIDQVHRVTSTIERTLEERKHCSAVFLDVAQAFDRVWHDGVAYKLSKLLLGNHCRLLESYLMDRSFRVTHEGARSEFYRIKAGVPQGSVLGPTLYLLYTADIPTVNDTVIATYADDTAITYVSECQRAATAKLQKALNRVINWTNDWKIKLNQQKSIHVTYTLRHVDRGC